MGSDPQRTPATGPPTAVFVAAIRWSPSSNVIPGAQLVGHCVSPEKVSAPSTGLWLLMAALSLIGCGIAAGFSVWWSLWARAERRHEVEMEVLRRPEVLVDWCRCRRHLSEADVSALGRGEADGGLDADGDVDADVDMDVGEPARGRATR